MRFTTRYLPALALIGLAIPALASGEARAPATVVAFDNGFREPVVTINAGETVTFSYPAGARLHNVAFTGDQPTSCTQTAGGSGMAPPLPPVPAGPGWEGNCRFDTPGSYPFLCVQHPVSMTGRVEVTASPATPTPSTSATPSPGTSPQATTAPPTTKPPSTALGPAASRLLLARNQRGQAFRGSVTVARPGSRLKIEGKRVIDSSKPVAAGTARFTVKLNAAARRILKRRGKLTVSVRITVTPASGAPFAASRTVTLKR